MTLTKPELTEALRALQHAKQIEAEATVARNSAEQTVLAIVGELPAEGTRRFGAGDLVAVIGTGVTRKVDQDKLTAIAADIPADVGKRLLRWKPELVTSELRYLQSNEPGIYAKVAMAIETRPAKPSIKLEAAKKETA